MGLSSRLLALGPGWLQRSRTGNVQSTVVDGVETLDNYVGQFLPQAVAAVLGATAVTAYLVVLDPLVGVIVLVCAVVTPIVPSLSRQLLEDCNRAWFAAYRGLYAENLDAVQGMATLSATAVAGVLIATIGARNALWIDAAGYGISAVLIGLVPRSLRGTGSPEGRSAGLSADIREGLRYVRRHPVIWPLTASGFGSGLADGAVVGLVVVYGVRQLGLADDDARLGWLFTALAIGGLAAGLTLPALSRRVNQPYITLAGLTAKIALLVSIALVPILAVSLVLLAAWGVASTLVIANGITLRQQLTPDRLQGRVNVTARMIAAGGMPIGAAVGGFLADQINIQAALVLMTLCVAASAAYAWSSPLRRTDAAAITRMREEAEQPG